MNVQNDGRQDGQAGARSEGPAAGGFVVGMDIPRVLREQGMLVNTTVGISMFPMLRNRRDVIVVKPLAAGERLAVGDVALYWVRGAGAGAGAARKAGDAGAGATGTSTGAVAGSDGAGAGAVRKNGDAGAGALGDGAHLDARAHCGVHYVLHRVVGVRDGWYAIRGDNCLETEHVADAQVLGRLMEFYRGERHVVCGTSRAYRRYWRLWLAVWPARRFWKLVRRAVGRALRLFGWKGLRRKPF